MSDVTETLQDLMERRLREMGKRRGRGESISLREAYQRLVDYTNDRNRERAERNEEPEPAPPTYEVFRRIRNGHTKISDPTATALATMLDVPVGDVYAAARIRPRLGRFELPTRADRLDDSQRQVVVSVVDAILQAGSQAHTGQVPGNVRDLRAAAARSTGKLSKGQQRKLAEQVGEAGDPGTDDFEPR